MSQIHFWNLLRSVALASPGWLKTFPAYSPIANTDRATLHVPADGALLVPV